MAVYGEKVMEHFRNPRNVGVMENPDGVGEVGNPICGDMMTFYIKVDDNKLSNVKFQTFGCGAAIAVSSMISEMAQGKTLDEALKISNKVVAEALGGLPVQKMHCSNLGAEALHKAIEDYKQKQQQASPKNSASNPDPSDCSPKSKGECFCPYCESSTPMSFPFCKKCGVKLSFCSQCGKPLPKKAKKCPNCGAPVEPKE